MCIRNVQRKAARFATSNYTREPGTVTTILQNLGWQTLENRRKWLGRMVVTVPGSLV
jgi:hypothetical protein